MNTQKYCKVIPQSSSPLPASSQDLPENLSVIKMTEEQFNKQFILSCFNLPPELASTCSNYYLLHWSGEYFQNLYYQTSGRFIHQDITYHVIPWNDDMRGILSAKKVILSFRKLPDTEHGYVLVKPASPAILDPKKEY